MSSRSSGPDGGQPARPAPTEVPTRPETPGGPTPAEPWRRRAFLGLVGVATAAVGGVVAWLARGGWSRSELPGVSTRTKPPAPTIATQTARGWVAVDFVAEGVARVRITETADQLLAHSYAVEQPLVAQPAGSMTSDTELALSTPQFSVAVDRTTGAVSARTAAGVPFVTETERGYSSGSSGFRWQLRLTDDETSHGLGQRAFGLSLRGRSLELWNFDAGSYRPGDDPLYLSVPFYLGHRSGLTYGIFWDCPARSRIDLDALDTQTLTFSGEQGPALFYLIHADSPQQVVERYAQLTGLMELPPLWALGYHQSRWSYRDADHFRRIAARLRAERVPCDALHFDIDYMDGFRVFTWDDDRFPDLPGLIKDLFSQGFQSVAILDPGVKVDPNYVAFRDGVTQDVFLRDASGTPVEREVWPGVCRFPDFTAPRARAWWSSQVAQFARAGFAGLWNDMNEPATFDDKSRTLPDDVRHDWEGQGNTHVGGGHAVYGMQMARATREGLAAARPERRPFVMSRAGYAGLQRYATTWNGDSRASWGHLQMTVPQLCNVGISGIPFSGSDAGGFRGDPDGELYLRWMQLASMTPFFRTHSARTAVERNPWTYGEPTTSRLRAVVHRRYALLPYLYTQVQRAATTGTPIVRPMFFEQPNDPAFQRIDDQFMLGDALLVAPILEPGARRRTVHLPPGTWYAYGSGATQPGGRSFVAEAGWDLPLLVRAGAVVPRWPVRPSVATPVEQLILDVYAGSGTSSLYEDAGDGFGYRRGEFLSSTFTTSTSNTGLEVTWRTAGRYQPPTPDVEVRIYGLADPPLQVTVDGNPVDVRFEQKTVVLAPGRFTSLTVAS